VAQLVPRVPTACAPHICVGSCPDNADAGDRVYLKATGPCGEHVTEDVTPVCDTSVDNPAMGCESDGDPQWKVNPSPPPIATPSPSPQGEPQ
jgi:hypothetical protein